MKDCWREHGLGITIVPIKMLLLGAESFGFFA